MLKDLFPGNRPVAVGHLRLIVGHIISCWVEI